MKRQYRVVVSFFIIISGLLGITLSASADTVVSGDELKTLISGNTVEGKYIKWETTHKMFFDANGNISRIDSNNNKEKGKWYVNKDGELCIEMRKENCNEVTKRDDGGYNVSRKGQVKFTMDKIVPGNPHNL